jgi:hypothetical protein
MADDPATKKQILHIKVRAPTADAAEMLASMMKNSAGFYEAFGGVRIRLLRNVDDPAQFVQIIDIITAWRSMFPGAIEFDVYEDVTESQ